MKKQIAWQKFEEIIQEQLKSPIVQMITDHHNEELEKYLGDDRDLLSEGLGEEGKLVSAKPLLAMPNDLGEEIYMSSAYQCWVGHTNFDLDREMDYAISRSPGVEKSTVYTRYRFVVGFGKVFDADTAKNEIAKRLGVPEGRSGLLF